GAIARQVLELVRVLMEAMDVEMRGDRRLLRKLGEGRSLVDAVLCHAAVGRPFAAGDAEQPRAVDVDGVVARDGGGAPCMSAAHQGAYADEDAQHVGPRRSFVEVAPRS